MYNKIPWNKGLPKEMQPRYGIVGYWKGKVSGMAGKHHTEETKLKMRMNSNKEALAKSKLGEKNPMFGKKHSEEIKRKISLANKGKPSWIKGKHQSDKTKEKIRLALLGIKRSIKTIEKDKIATIRRFLSGVYSIKPNKPEQYLIKLFQQHNLPFRYVGDRKFWIDYNNPDFIDEANKKIIEFDGLYWHSMPDAIKRNERRNLTYLDKGYDVMLLNEDNLKDEHKLINDIKTFWVDTI